MSRADAPDMPDTGGPDREPDDAKLLEAALDGCITMAAAAAAAEARRTRAMDGASPVPPPPGDPGPPATCVFSVRLAWLRGWLGRDCTKREVKALFDGAVARRYLDGGWVGVGAGCGAPSAAMSFRFGPAPKVQPETRRVPDVRERGTAALAELGEIFGVRRTDSRDQESTVAFLEDLRLAARLMRFDLEASRRETEQARGMIDFISRHGTHDGAPDDSDDDGHYPPFEGDPDDENFGNG